MADEILMYRGDQFDRHGMLHGSDGDQPHFCVGTPPAGWNTWAVWEAFGEGADPGLQISLDCIGDWAAPVDRGSGDPNLEVRGALGGDGLFIQFPWWQDGDPNTILNPDPGYMTIGRRIIRRPGDMSDVGWVDWTYSAIRYGTSGEFVAGGAYVVLECNAARLTLSCFVATEFGGVDLTAIYFEDYPTSGSLETIIIDHAVTIDGVYLLITRQGAGPLQWDTDIGSTPVQFPDGTVFIESVGGPSTLRAMAPVVRWANPAVVPDPHIDLMYQQETQLIRTEGGPCGQIHVGPIVVANCS